MNDIKRFRQFLLEDLWRITAQDRKTLTPLQLFFYPILKRLVLSIQRFIQDRMMDRASALTYTTLLALVPILAIIFAIARGFGFAKLVENLVRENFQGHDEVLSVLLDSVNTYITHTQSGVFLGIGFVFLIYTVVILTSNVEGAFNQIWQKTGRTPFRKLTDYFSVLLLVPLVWVIISGFTIFMTTLAKDLPNFMVLSYTVKFLIRLLPFLFIGLAFTSLYMFMPNTHVRFSCAWIPGFLAGSAFVGVQYFYINSQIWISNYNAIYGSFAALPMFLIWAQTSWSICLFGAELTYANQNVDSFNFEYDIQHSSRKMHDFIALLLLSTICKRFMKPGAKDYTANELAHELTLPLRMVTILLDELVSLGWLKRITYPDLSQNDSFTPGCDLSLIKAADVLNSIYENGKGDLRLDKEKFGQQWSKFCMTESNYREITKEILLKEF